MRTIERLLKRAAIAAALALLAGCGATPPGLVRADRPTKVARIMEITSPIAWSRYRAYNSELWTIDGAALNRVLFLAHVRDKHHVFGIGRATKQHPDGPFYRVGMDAGEIEAVIRDAITEAGLANVATNNLQPVRIGELPGFRFDARFQTSLGLQYLGSVTFFERKERLHIIWYSAPAEYYFPLNEAAVEKMLSSLRITK
jgi:hypothetical protein